MGWRPILTLMRVKIVKTIEMLSLSKSSHIRLLVYQIQNCN